MTTVDHLVLTRFNLPTPGPESLVRAQDGWLRNRVDLFERHTVPTMRQQTVTSFTWIVYFDPESPRWLIERLSPLVAEGLFTPIYRESVDWRDVVADARSAFTPHHDLLLTTNLDNDDAVSIDFIERLQEAARNSPGTAIYLRTGLIIEGDQVYLRDDRHNAFCSVSETWDDPATAWRDWHTLLRDHFPVRSIAGRPAWLQVIHGQNVSNRVHGRRIDPRSYSALFAGQLNDVARPSTRTLVVDRMLRHPARTVRDQVRRTGKTVLLSAFGKDGLDGLKSWMRRTR